MKLKLKVNNIESGADTIKIVAYNERNVIEEFKKEDYGEDWEGLKGKEIYINPYFVGDVNQLKVIGTKSHDLSWDDEEKRNLWKEYASDKADIFVLPYGRIDLDYGKTIKISNYKNVDSSDQNNIKYERSIICLFSTSYNTYYFDFSKYDSKDFFNNINSVNDCPAKVKKLPNIPKEINYLGGSSTFKGYTNLESVDNLDTSNIKNLDRFLYENKKIEDISNLDFSNLESATEAFYNTNIKKIPQPFSLPKLRNVQGYMFLGNNTIEIDEIDLSKSSNYTSENFDKVFWKVKINKMKLGNSYLALPRNYEIGVVNIGNAKDSLKRVVSGNTTSGPELNLYASGGNAIKAFPLNLMSETQPFIGTTPTTPPENTKIVWCDSIAEGDRTTTKSIVKKIDHINTTIKTLKNSFVGQIQIPLPFELNPNYPYKFELINTDYSEVIGGLVNEKGTNLKCNSAKIIQDENSNNLLLDLDLSDIKDGSYLEFYYNPSGLLYNAKIDGEDFSGRFRAKYNNSYDSAQYTIYFKIEENLDFGFELEEDSSDDTTE